MNYKNGMLMISLFVAVGSIQSVRAEATQDQEDKVFQRVWRKIKDNESLPSEKSLRVNVIDAAEDLKIELTKSEASQIARDLRKQAKDQRDERIREERAERQAQRARDAANRPQPAVSFGIGTPFGGVSVGNAPTYGYWDDPYYWGGWHNRWGGWGYRHHRNWWW